MQHKTKLMGIINVTPDSFYEKSRAYSSLSAIKRGILLEIEGADIIDVGGVSSRPGATPIDEDEEMRRVFPVITALKKEVRVPLSIDTYTPNVAKAAIDAGCTYINDITGFATSAMREAVKHSSCSLIVMHMRGTPQTMQQNPSYPEGVISHLVCWFQNRIRDLLEIGIDPKRIILDPGIGFGKTMDHNLQILRHFNELKQLGFPLLFGISRKSFMSKVLRREPEELLPATLAINSSLVFLGVDIIRVHDVKEHRDLIDIMEASYS